MNNILNKKTFICLSVILICIMSIFIIFAQNNVYAEEITPRYADNIYTSVSFSDGTTVNIDFIGRDLLWPFADEIKVRLSSNNVGAVSYQYKVIVQQKSGNYRANKTYTSNGQIGEEVFNKYLGQNFTYLGVTYKKWDVSQVTLQIELTYNGETKLREYVMAFD